MNDLLEALQELTATIEHQSELILKALQVLIESTSEAAESLRVIEDATDDLSGGAA